jgi:hypothetical protein
MRDLIRLTLFIVARLGLFLAVVGWIVSQWWTVSILFPLPTGMAGAELDAGSWQCRHALHQLSMAVTDIVRTRYSPISTVLVHEKFMLMWQIQQIEVPTGIAPSMTATFHPVYIPKRDLSKIPHWLIVVIFALFYGVLQWVYRKRGKELAADE